MGKLYDEKSIESLSPLEFTRLRPQVYCGDTSYSTQLLVEILSNAIDEVQAGHGKKIKITTTKVKDNDVFVVEDEGQGFIPNFKREDGKTILEAAFSVLNTSGKYREDGSYSGTALGSFGIGAKLINFLSNWATVETHRDGQYERIRFSEGVFEKRESGKLTSAMFPHGTVVSWQPSKEFFTNTSIDENYIKSLIQTLVCLCEGLAIEYNGKQYFSKSGLKDYIDNNLKKGTEILKNRFYLNHKEGKNQINLAMTYTSDYSSRIIPYVNTGLTESGTHITQIKTTLTREFNKFLKSKKWLKDKDENLSGDDIQEGLFLIFNLTAPSVAYDAQVKSKITKIDMKPFLFIFAEELQLYFERNEKEIKVIADKAIKARKAREAARKARDNARGDTKPKGLRNKMKVSEKFIDCISKNPKERNLVLVEGLSAASAAVEARNTKTDCLYMLRGKILSSRKVGMDKISANQELSDLITIIGGGVGKSFDVTKMNFDKVVIAADADSDGADISLLLMTFFFTYMRPLVEAGKLYRAVTPLYIIRNGKSEKFFFTEQEMDEWRKTGEKGDVVRAKG